MNRSRSRRGPVPIVLPLGILASVLCVPAGGARADSPGLDEAVVAQVTASTVFVECTWRPIEDSSDSVRKEALRRSSGSGFVIGEDGLVLTNAHVVSAYQVMDDHVDVEPFSAKLPQVKPHALYVLQSVRVRARSGTPDSKIYDAQILGARDTPSDLALLRIDPEERLPALELAPEGATPKLTQRVWAVGFPLGNTLVRDLADFAKITPNPSGPDVSLREGTVTSNRTDGVGGLAAIEHNANIEHGNSGGPLVDARGRVVGINTWGLGESTRMAIPADVARREFARTLHWIQARRDRKFPRRVVDPAGGGTHRTLAEALDGSKEGDEIVLKSGAHEVAGDLRVPPGVTLRGGGPAAAHLVGRGTLVLGSGAAPEDMPMSASPRPAAGKSAPPEAGRDPFEEVGGFSLGDSEYRAKASVRLLCCSGCGTESFVHDIAFFGTYRPAVAIHGASSPQLENLQFDFQGSLLEVDAWVDGHGGGAARLRRSQVGIGLAVGAAAHLTMEGCNLFPNAIASGVCLDADAGSSLTISGCRFYVTQSGTGGVRTHGGKLSISTSLLVGSDSVHLVDAMEGAQVTVEDCDFLGHASLVSAGDDGTSLTLRSSRLEDVGVSAYRSAIVHLERDAFLAVRGPGGAMATWFDSVASDPSLYVYALRVDGAETGAVYAKCLFWTDFGGTAIGFSDGARDASGEGNRFVGGSDKLRR